MPLPERQLRQGRVTPAITQIEGHEHYNTLIPLKTIKKENKHDEVRTVL